MEALRELTVVAIIGRVILSMVIGGIIGYERLTKNQPAGSRTYMLVCLGACLVMMTNQYISQMFQTGDPSRLGAQVVSGIGFLGAGTILVTRTNQIKGLTTAAGLWSSACIGLAICIGFYEGAIAVGVALFLIMTVFRRMDRRVKENSKYLCLNMMFENNEALSHFIEDCGKKHVRLEDLQITKPGKKSENVIAVLTLHFEKKTNHSEMISYISGLSGVSFVEEL